MKIAFISHDAELHGATRSLIALAQGLQKLNVICYFFLPYKGIATTVLDAEKIPYFIIPYTRWAISEQEKNNAGFIEKIRIKKMALRKVYRNIKLIPKLNSQLKECGIDIIYTNTFVTSIGVLSALILKKPHVWHIREFINTDFHLELGKNIFSFFLNKSNARIVNSNALKKYIETYFRSKASHVVYNGIAFNHEFDTFLQKRKPLNNSYYTFAIIGFINNNKNQKVAIEALGLLSKKYDKVKLIIAGGGDYSELKSLANSLGIGDKIGFLGQVTDPYEVYFKVDAVLVCSKNEGFGRVAAEAMSACVPVIGFDSTGTAEIVNHEYTGLLYRGGAQELAECMEKFIKNPSWARELGLNGWTVAKEKYTIESYTKTIYTILESIAYTRGKLLLN